MSQQGRGGFDTFPSEKCAGSESTPRGGTNGDKSPQ